MYLVWRRKHLIWCVIFCAVGIAAGFAASFQGEKSTSFSGGVDRVIIDAGHGLPDGGAVGSGGTVEQEINLKIAKKLQEVLQGKGISVIMTRESEKGLFEKETSIRDMKITDMHRRLEIMKTADADLFISIHMNFFPAASANGLRVFYSANHSEIKPLAEHIQKRMGEVTGARTTAVKAADKSLFLMKNPPLPSLLVECGFLSNPTEEKKLNDEEYQSRLAWAIADGVEKFVEKEK